MATERHSMRQIREVLRQKWVLGRSHRDVHRSLGVSTGAVSMVATRARAAGLDWAAVEALDDPALERRVYGEGSAAQAGGPVTLPDPLAIHIELKRTGVTRELLHQEYLQSSPNGVGYTTFCGIYRRWLARQRPTMRQEHRAGEKAFVDYSGKRPEIIDAETGECIAVELFVAVLGASNFTFAEATRTQRSVDWIASNMHALEYFGGAPELLVPDQLKSGVTRPCWYEPGVQRTYGDFATHYGTAVLPARPGKSRDKAKVEGAVLIAQRWIVARMRNMRFFSIAEMNMYIRVLLDELNDRVMRTYGESRRTLFERLDRPALRPLPPVRFEYAEWALARVHIDYHVEHDHHFYSVPFQLIHEQVRVCATATTIEIEHNNKRVALHPRSSVRGRHTTVGEHMPKAHQRHAEWTPARISNWAATIGPHTAGMVRTIMEKRTHPEQGYRSCLGILRMSKQYGSERLEAACKRGLAVGALSYRNIESILKHGLDRAPSLDETEREADAIVHENLRGRNYYH